MLLSGGTSKSYHSPAFAQVELAVSFLPPYGFSAVPLRLFIYQIVGTAFDRRMFRSAVTSRRPSTSAVAPIIRSAGSLG